MDKKNTLLKPYLPPETGVFPMIPESGLMGASTDVQTDIEGLKELDQYQW
ncbi:MAG: hypothetical protein IK143_05740 [Bacteroidales bacterium]|nr:hypothetical protein [Bacteroidales bacterium]